MSRFLNALMPTHAALLEAFSKPSTEMLHNSQPKGRPSIQPTAPIIPILTPEQAHFARIRELDRRYDLARTDDARTNIQNLIDQENTRWSLSQVSEQPSTKEESKI